MQVAIFGHERGKKMSGLRIMFEVDEKHVGACLVALEGRARNLKSGKSLVVAKSGHNRRKNGK